MFAVILNYEIISTSLKTNFIQVLRFLQHSHHHQPLKLTTNERYIRSNCMAVEKQQNYNLREEKGKIEIILH